MRAKSNKTLDILDCYKLIQADIKEIDFKIEELEEKGIITNKNDLGIRTSQTHNIVSSVEKAIERKDDLRIRQEKMHRQLKRIDNALTILTDEERDIIQIVHIDHKKYYIVQEKLKLSYQRIKQLEKQAAKKMDEYVFGKEGYHG